MNKSNSSVPGIACFPRIVAFNESASKLKGTLSAKIFGRPFNFLPVKALPVKVTTSCVET